MQLFIKICFFEKNEYTRVDFIYFFMLDTRDVHEELHEKSAGGIVYRRRNGELEILMLAWKNAKEETEYVLPKGKIENEETAAETAVREIAEET